MTDCKCGPFWFPKFLKCWLSRQFNDACILHDLDYKKQSMSREHADSKFLNLMLSQSDNLWQVMLAFIMFGFVRMFGWVSWYKSKVENFYHAQ